MVNKLKFLQNKKVAMLGLGVENLALVKFLLKQTTPSPCLTSAVGQASLKRRGDLHITVCDPKSAAELGDRFLEIKELAPHSAKATRGKQTSCRTVLSFQTGADYDKNLDKFDIVFRSPGYPLFNPNLIKAKKAAGRNSTSRLFCFCLKPRWQARRALVFAKASAQFSIVCKQLAGIFLLS